MSNNYEYKLVRGMKDLCNIDAQKFDFIVNSANKVAEKYNFKHLMTPIVEYSSLFERNLGEESDIVHKEIYKFEDRGGDMLALRPEMTASVCRYVISNGLFQGPFPHKFFSFGQIFRYDRPQKGRYRQFHQLNFEIFGLKDMANEIKIYMNSIREFLEIIGIKDVVIKINYLGSNEERNKYIEVLKDYLTKNKDKLSEDSARRLNTNILRVLDSKDGGDKEILKNAPVILDYLSKEHKDFLNSFDKDKYVIDSCLVRGLDYYSGFVFEVITDKIGETQNAVCGGGEYNNLVENMSGKKLTAFGFAFGIERLMDLMDESLICKDKKPLYCHITSKSTPIENARNEICYFDDISKGLKWANQIGADFVIFEKDGNLISKNLSSGEQQVIV